MVISPKKILSNNAPLKIFSLVLGYMVWSVFSSGNIITLETKASLCFYNVPDEYAIQAPENIQVTLVGKRSDVYKLLTDTLAIHLDASAMHKGNNPIQLTKDTLFLPDSIKLVHYTPAPLIVEMAKK